jgi:hypothetical protein
MHFELAELTGNLTSTAIWRVAERSAEKYKPKLTRRAYKQLDSACRHLQPASARECILPKTDVDVNPFDMIHQETTRNPKIPD